jgi:hypothetical protein
MPTATATRRRRHPHPPGRRLALVKDEPVAELTGEGQDWLHALDDDYLSCRIKHKWPDYDLRKGKRPRGVSYFAQPDGRVTETETCSRCGKQRWRLSKIGGYLDPHANWHYEDPPGFKSPKGANVTRSTCRLEYARRVDESPVGQMMQDMAATVLQHQDGGVLAG